MFPTAREVATLTFDVLTVTVVPSSVMFESPKELPPPVNFTTVLFVPLIDTDVPALPAVPEVPALPAAPDAPLEPLEPAVSKNTKNSSLLFQVPA